jgi:hypothetical protein
LNDSKRNTNKELSNSEVNSNNRNAEHLSCWYTNATSLNNKFDDLILEASYKRPHVIMICETWWTESSVSNIKGYSLFRRDRINKIGRGVRNYVKDSINSYCVAEINLSSDKIEQVWCSIEIGNERVLCGVIYRTGDSELNY